MLYLFIVMRRLWGGDKSAEGKLKALITEDILTVELKNIDPFQIKNHTRLIISSNNDWVIPAGLEERRFNVIEVSDKKMQDRGYFGPIISQMDNGGREAMLYDLLHLDIKQFDPGDFPRTKALFNQIFRTMSSFEKFWYERLADGFLMKGEDGTWTGRVLIESFYDAFVEYSKKASKLPSF